MPGRSGRSREKLSALSYQLSVKPDSEQNCFVSGYALAVSLILRHLVQFISGGLPENTAQVPDRAPFFIFENASARDPQGRRRYDPIHALPEGEETLGVLLKLRYLRRLC